MYKPWMRTVAEAVASASKDPGTKVGALLLVGDCIVSTGYNGFKRGADDTLLHNREYKLANVVHAEENCLINCDARCALRGAWVLVTHRPCISCLRLLRFKGIDVIKYLNPLPEREPWSSMRGQLDEYAFEYGMQVTLVQP